MSLIKTFQNALYFGVVPKLPVLVNALVLPFITPFLTPYDYGVWGVVNSYVGLILAIVPLGLNMHLTNSFFEYSKWPLVWGRILFLFFVSGTIGALLLFCILFIDLREMPLTERICLGICGAVPIMIFGNTTIAQHLYPLRQEPKPLVYRNFAAGICASAVSFISIYYFKLGFWGFVLASLVSGILTFLLFVKPLYYKHNIKPTIDRNWKRVKKWLIVASPVIPHTIGFILLNSSSRIVMSWWNVPLDDIGVYTNGYSMGDFVTIVATSLLTALSPQLQRAYREKRFNDYRHLFYLCQMIVICAIFCVSMWMPDIYKLMIRNPLFQDSIPIASYVCYANAILPFYTFTSCILFIERQTKQLLWLVFLPGCLNVCLCMITVPIWGYKAVVYCILIAFWSQLLVPFLSKFHRSILNTWFGSVLKLLPLCPMMVVALVFSNMLSTLNIINKVFITILIVFLFIGVIKHQKWDKAII